MVITKIPIFRHAYFRAEYHGPMIYRRRDVSVSSSLPPALCYDDKRSHAGGTVGTLSSSMMSPHRWHATHASLEAGQQRRSLSHVVPGGETPPLTSFVKTSPKGTGWCLWPWIPLLCEINGQLDGLQAASVLRSTSALEGTRHHRHKVMRQQNRESPRLTGGWNLCHVFHNVLFLCSSSWSLSPSPSSPRSAAWRRRTTWIFWREWYRKVSSVNLFL